MLSDNIKNLRKAKGLSQDELAVKLNVVRQTISKWETGLSVPDSEMLIAIAAALDTTVSVLLDETIAPDTNSELKIIANKLEILNEQIIKLHESRRKLWRLVFILAFTLAACVLLGGLFRYIYMLSTLNEISASTAIIGGSDGPTAIFVTKQAWKSLPFPIALLIIAVSAIGIHKTRKK